MYKFKKFKNKFKSIWQHKISRDLLGVVDNANIGILFLLAMGNVLSGAASFVVLPIAIGTNLLHAILDIRDAYVNKTKSSISNAVASSLTALGVIAAVVCTFIGGAALGVVAPAILTGVLGARALYDLGAGCYFWYKYHKCKYTNPEKAAAYYKKAKEHTITFVVAALAATASGALLLGHHSSFGILGGVAGAIGAGYASYGIYKVYKEYKSRKTAHQNQIQVQNSLLDQPSENSLSNNARIYQQIGFNPQPQIQETMPAPPNEQATTFVFEIHPNNQAIVEQVPTQQVLSYPEKRSLRRHR